MHLMNATSHTFNPYPMEHSQCNGMASRVDSLHVLGLDEFLVPNPMNTVLFRAKDDQLSSEGIFKGDLLVVDRSLKPEPSQIVVINEESQLTLRYFLRPRPNVLKTYSPQVEFTDHPNRLIALESMNIWGVVTYCLHRLNSVWSFESLGVDPFFYFIVTNFNSPLRCCCSMGMCWSKLKEVVGNSVQ